MERWGKRDEVGDRRNRRTDETSRGRRKRRSRWREGGGAGKLSQ